MVWTEPYRSYHSAGVSPLYFPNSTATALGIEADGAHRVLAWYQRTCLYTIKELQSEGKRGSGAKYLMKMTSEDD